MQAIGNSVLEKHCTLDGGHREGCRHGLPLMHRSMPSKPFVSRMYPKPSAPGRGYLRRAVEGKGHIGGTPEQGEGLGGNERPGKKGNKPRGSSGVKRTSRCHWERASWPLGVKPAWRAQA